MLGSRFVNRPYNPLTICILHTDKKNGQICQLSSLFQLKELEGRDFRQKA